MLSIRGKINVAKERQKNDGTELLRNIILLNLPKRFSLERKAKQKKRSTRKRRYSATGKFQRRLIRFLE